MRPTCILRHSAVVKRFEHISGHLSPFLRARQQNKHFLRYTLGASLLGAPPCTHFCASADKPGQSGVEHNPCAADTHRKLKVVLDIDECLVHSIFDGDNEYRQQEDRPDLAGQDKPKTVEQFQLVMHDGATCMVNKRYAEQFALSLAPR